MKRTFLLFIIFITNCVVTFSNPLQENNIAMVSSIELNQFQNMKTIKKETVGSYSINYIEYEPMPEEKVGKLLFQKKDSNEFYSTSHVSEEIIYKFPNSENILLVKSAQCINCGASIEFNLYVILENKISILEFNIDFEEYGCPCYKKDVFMASPIYIRNETRYDINNKKIYIYKIIPDCSEFKKDDDDLIRCSKETILIPKKVNKEVFTVISIGSNDIKVLEFFNKGIPHEYLSYWANLKKLNFKYYNTVD